MQQELEFRMVSGVKGLMCRILFLLGAVPLGQLRAQTLPVRRFSTEDGLPTIMLLALAQDSRGQLWVGGQGGVAYYDGRSFHSVDKSQGLAENTVYGLAPAAHGDMWLGHGLGSISYYQAATGRAESVLPQEYGRTLYPRALLPVRPDGQALWLATWSHGLHRLERRVSSNGLATYHITERLGRAQGLPSDTITALAPAPQGLLWVGTTRGLCLWNPAQRRQAPLPAPLPSRITQRPVLRLALAADGRVWCVLPGQGAAVLDPLPPGGAAEWPVRFFGPEQGLPSKQVLGVAPMPAVAGQAGRVWLLTRQGLYYLPTPTATVVRYISNTDLKSNHLGNVLGDSEGSVWASDDQGLVQCLPPGRFSQFGEADGLPGAEVHAVVPISAATRSPSAYWVGTNGGLALFHPENARRAATAQRIATGQAGVSFVRALLTEPNGDVLAGGERLEGGHVARYSPRTGQWQILLSSKQEPLRRGIVTCLARDRRGRIWVGTTVGLYILGSDTEPPRFYEAAALAGGFGVWSFCLAPDGVMWLAVGDVGVVRADENAAGELQFRVAPGPGLPPMVGTLDRDPAGRLWLGSSDTGLYCYDPAQPKLGARRVALPPGSAYDSPYIVRCDSAGQVWLGTAVGVARYSPATRQTLVLARQQGFMGKETNQNASTIDPDGNVWMGTVMGLMRYKPTLPGGPRRTPPVQLTSLRIFLADTLLRPGLQLPARLNHLTFDYLGVSLSQPDALRYRYRLTGFDEDWSRPLATTTATYTNLPPGGYTFEVRAANGEGRWSPQPASFSFRIAPPWWRTWWAYLVYVSAFALLLYTVRRFTQNRERERADRELERQALNHLQELDRVKTDFFTNVSHELRTPLTLILGPAEMLATEPADAAVREQGNLVLRNARRLLTLINRLLELSKLEAGALRLLPTSGDAVRTTRQLVAAFEPLAESRGIELCFEATDAPLPLVFDEAKLEDILTNLLANALRFTPAAGEVRVRVLRTAATAMAPLGGVSITVQDSGVGIAAADVPYLFDRFYQASAPDAGPLRTGTGIGLALVRELTELHGGTVAASSVPGAGATFTVWLPAGLRPVAETPTLVTAPLSPIESVAAELAMAAEQSADTPSLSPGADLVLIIEDSPEIREFIRATLVGEGYRLLLAADGAAGIILAQTEVPDLVVSDVMMPGLDGYQVCAQLKTAPATSHIPVVLLTAKSSPESRLEGLETGADSFLAKPFAPRELRAQVRNLLALRRQVRARVAAALRPASPSEELPATLDAAVAPDPLATHVAAVAALPSADQKFLNRLNELILQHLDDEDFGVDQLGQEIGLSRTQLHRKLKAITGQSPGDCIRQTRLLRALALLQARVGTVAEVSYQVGFSSPNHFSTAFSKQFGYPPSAVAKGEVA